MEWPTQELVVIDIKEASPVAFINVYEDGDIWMKIVGCEACRMPSPARCCGRCPFATIDGCAWHAKNFSLGSVSDKSLGCIVLPRITKKRTDKCSLIYKCVRGSMKGKYRRIFDHADVFQDSI